VKSIRTSWREVNRPHPWLAGPMAGLFAVALYTLFVPGGLEPAHAWGLFVSVGAGAGLGLFVVERRRGSAEEDDT
jgi:hypothetical protein